MKRKRVEGAKRKAASEAASDAARSSGSGPHQSGSPASLHPVQSAKGPTQRENLGQSERQAQLRPSEISEEELDRIIDQSYEAPYDYDDTFYEDEHGERRPRRKLITPLSPTAWRPVGPALVLNHVHSAQAIISWIVGFNAIVADPVPALTVALVPLAIAQLAWLLLCVPPYNKDVARSRTANKKNTQYRQPHQEQVKGQRHHQEGQNAASQLAGNIPMALLSLFVSLLVGTPALAVFLVLFGAPVTTHHLQTLLCAAHLAVLCGPAVIYSRGLTAQNWLRICALMVPLDEAFGAVIGTFLGAWFGAVPIPLDWDRDWQKWPITILTGAYFGFAVGKFCGGTFFRGKIVRFD